MLTPLSLPIPQTPHPKLYQFNLSAPGFIFISFEYLEILGYLSSVPFGNRKQTILTLGFKGMLRYVVRKTIAKHWITRRLVTVFLLALQ